MRKLINRIERIETASAIEAEPKAAVIFWDVFDVGREEPSAGPADIIAGPLSGQRIEPKQSETCDAFQSRINRMVDAARTPNSGGAS